jgi:hypothetical protein
MSSQELGGVIVAFVIIAAVTAAAQFEWLGSGNFKRIFVFIAGAAAVGSLFMAGIPPWWFAGEKAGFGLSVSLLLGAWIASRNPGERTFGRPLLAGMGWTLLAINIVRFVLARL